MATLIQIGGHREALARTDKGASVTRPIFFCFGRIFPKRKGGGRMLTVVDYELTPRKHYLDGQSARAIPTELGQSRPTATSVHCRPRRLSGSGWIGPKPIDLWPRCMIRSYRTRKSSSLRGATQFPPPITFQSTYLRHTMHSHSSVDLRASESRPR